MKHSLLKSLKKDCSTQGFGRKKWWAEQLGVPPLTLSHWLAGRQKPNGQNALAIQKILEEQQEKDLKQVWKDYLWEAYRLGKEPDQKLLSALTLELLSFTSLDSRTLALLSKMLEKKKPKIPLPKTASLRNRLGWILENSGLIANFSPDASAGLQIILETASKQSGLRKFLQRFQTIIGKRWFIYDTSLDSMKASLP